MTLPFFKSRYQKWCEKLQAQEREIWREVNCRMMGRDIITQEEITAQIKENARALRKMCKPSLWERIKTGWQT